MARTQGFYRNLERLRHIHLPSPALQSQGMGVLGDLGPPWVSRAGGSPLAMAPSSGAFGMGGQCWEFGSLRARMSRPPSTGLRVPTSRWQNQGAEAGSSCTSSAGPFQERKWISWSLKLHRLPHQPKNQKRWSRNQGVFYPAQGIWRTVNLESSGACAFN